MKLWALPVLWACAEAILESNASDPRLFFVQAMWRHGDRSPQSTFPADPIKAEMWPYGLGRLSPRGMEQGMRLGARLRERYVETGFLSSEYEPSELYVMSSSFDRTISAAYSVLVGLYSQNSSRVIPHSGPGDAIRWPTNYVPIPVRTMEDARDHDKC
ncbi:unnamed protein product, partial [Mesorhabditis spiculigera]